MELTMEEYLNRRDDLGIKNLEEESLDNLTDYIVKKYHSHLWIEMPKVITLLALIVDERSLDQVGLIKVKKLFVSLKNKLEQHLQTEENVQYKAIQKYVELNSYKDLKVAADMIDELEQDHTQMKDIIKEIRSISSDQYVCQSFCPSYMAGYSRIDQITLKILELFQIEEEVLFPRLRQMMNNN